MSFIDVAALAEQWLVSCPNVRKSSYSSSADFNCSEAAESGDNQAKANNAENTPPLILARNFAIVYMLDYFLLAYSLASPRCMANAFYRKNFTLLPKHSLRGYFCYARLNSRYKKIKRNRLEGILGANKF